MRHLLPPNYANLIKDTKARFSFNNKMQIKSNLGLQYIEVFF